MTPSPTALPEPALWAGYEFLKEQTIKIHFRGDSCRKQYGFQPWIYLNWEYISISLYSHLWLYFRLPGPHMTHKTPLGISDVILKPMQSDLVCGKQFFGAKFQTYRPTFGTGLGWFTSIFGYFLQQYLGEIFSVQRCNAPNAPKISILIFRICIKLNLGFILAILWYFWHYTSDGVMGPPHTPKIQILKVTLECASPIQIHSLI